MIDWNNTRIKYNRSDLSGPRPRVIVICDKCGAEGTKRIERKSSVVDGQLPWECAKCIANRPEKVEQSRKGAIKAWENPEYRKQAEKHLNKQRSSSNFKKRMKQVYASKKFRSKMDMVNKTKTLTKEGLESLRRAIIERWKDPEVRKRTINKLSIALKRRWQNKRQRDVMAIASKNRWKDPEYKKAISDSSRKHWENQEYRDRVIESLNSPETKLKISQASKQNWENPEYRDKVFDATKRVSSIQILFYSILDDLNIPYYRERNDGNDDAQCRIGPYSFDCVIPRQSGPTLLIEIQGEYWHSLPGIAARDKAKANYIANNFAGIYELKYVWEHEFLDLNKICTLLSYWTGAGIDNIPFSFKEVEVGKCKAAEVNELYAKYHYLMTGGRGGISYGAYHNDILIAACTFSPLARQNIKIKQYMAEKTRELSRFCIHPSYQKKNFASWFLSRCIRLLPEKYECIISYADATFNHCGTIYQATNFVFDKKVRPDYWYVSNGGWVMHKKTLYNRARQMSATETEYAKLHGYIKVYGSEKTRYIYER